jgi:hypothetical protein
MDGDFEIAPGSLDVSAQGIQRCGEDFATAVATLRARVLGAGSPWGNDSTGSMFGQIYAECTGVGLHALDHTAQLLGSIATSLSQMSQNVVADDQGNAAGFDRIH